jgi:hypothetical protein
VIKQDSGGNVLDDKESITADPSSGYVYAIWDRLEAPNSHANLKATENAIGYRGPTWFASSADNGQSWSHARMIYDPGEVNQTIANRSRSRPTAHSSTSSCRSTTSRTRTAAGASASP